MTTAGAPPAAGGERARAPRSLRNVVTTWGAFVFTIAVNFFVAPFVVQTLGTTAYGTWILLTSFVGPMGLLDLGVRSAVLRFVALHHARGEDAEASASASAGLTVFGIMAGVVLVLSLVGSVVLDRLFTVPPELIGTARLGVVIAGLTVAVSLVGGVVGGTLAALQRFDLQGWINIGGAAVRAFAMVLVLRAGGGIIGVACVQLVAALLQAGLQFAATRRLYPQLRFRIGAVDRARLGAMFSFGMYSSLLHLSSALVFSLHAIVIGSALPVAMITYFAIASTLMDYTRQVVGAISQTLTPRASALSGVGATAELERVVLRAGNIATLVTLAITITFVFRGATFIRLWMGPEFAALSGQILQILAVAISFDAARRIAMSTLIGMNRHRRLAPFYLTEGVLNVGLSVLWVRTIGLHGVALGMAIPNLVTALLVIPWLVREALGTSYGAFWRTLWIRPLLAMIPFAAVTALIERAAPADTLIMFFATVAVALPVAAAGAWLVGLTPAERTAYAAALRPGRRRPA